MIKVVTSAELPSVVDLAEWFYHRQLRPGKFDREVWVKTWATLMDSGAGMILQRTFEGRTTEAIGVLLYPDPNTGQLAAYSGFWYIADDSKSLAGGLLYSQLERLLRERGVKSIFITALTDNREAKVSNYLLKSGYWPVEVVYGKELAQCP